MRAKKLHVEVFLLMQTALTLVLLYVIVITLEAAEEHHHHIRKTGEGVEPDILRKNSVGDNEEEVDREVEEEGKLELLKELTVEISPYPFMAQYALFFIIANSHYRTVENSVTLVK